MQNGDSVSESRHVQVAIVGGGPAGLTAAALLARRGIEVVLLERRDGEPRLPKAHIVNQRTMEILREAGVADRVYELGSPAGEHESGCLVHVMGRPDRASRPRAGALRLLGRRCRPGGSPSRPAPAGPRTSPDHALEPVLMEHARGLLGSDLLGGSRGGRPAAARRPGRARVRRPAQPVATAS